MANVHLNHSMYESLTRKNGLVCDPPREVKIEDVLKAIGKIVGLHNIRAASQMNKKVVVLVSVVHMVTSVVEQGLIVHPDLFLLVSPLDTPAVKVNVSNTPPFIRNNDLCAQLSKFSTIVSKITIVPIHSGSGEFKHMMTFKRVHDIA